MQRDDPNDRFCFYCQQQFETKYNLLKHVKREHLGVYYNLRESPDYAHDIARLEIREPLL